MELYTYILHGLPNNSIYMVDSHETWTHLYYFVQWPAIKQLVHVYAQFLSHKMCKKSGQQIYKIVCTRMGN